MLVLVYALKCKNIDTQRAFKMINETLLLYEPVVNDNHHKEGDKGFIYMTSEFLKNLCVKQDHNPFATHH